MQAELTSIWESTGVQEENVPCEGKKIKKKRHTVWMEERFNKRKMDKELEERNHEKKREDCAQNPKSSRK